MSDSFEETPQNIPNDHAEEEASDPPTAPEADQQQAPGTPEAAASSLPPPADEASVQEASPDRDDTSVAQSPERDDHSDSDAPEPTSTAVAAPPAAVAAAPTERHASAPNHSSSGAAAASRRTGGATTPNNTVRSSTGGRGDGYSPSRSNAGSRADSRLPPIGGGSVQRSHHQPLIASVSYPPRQEGLTVADFLDPSKPLVKSTLPLTKPRGPSFAEEETAEMRKQVHAEKRMHSALTSSQILAQRNNERKYLKAQYEFEREKKIAERAIYHKERCMQWAQRLGANPLAVDLVADNERIEEEAFVREKEEKHRQAVADRRKRRIKRAIIVKALAEVPLLEKARKEKRELVEGEKREKALRDVQRVEAIQQRKLLDQELMVRERQSKLDQRMMSGNSMNASR